MKNTQFKKNKQNCFRNNDVYVMLFFLGCQKTISNFKGVNCSDHPLCSSTQQ